VTDDSAIPLSRLVGTNCKRIRTDIGVTQEDLARHARAAGLRWTASKVGDFEGGRSAPTFATVLAVTRALQSAVQEAPKRRAGGVTLADLVVGDGFVTLNENLDVRAERLADVCRGQVFALGKGNWRSPLRPLSATEVTALVGNLQRSGLAEQRLAQRLGITGDHLAVLSSRLWKKTFSEERDHRAGSDANRQKRGQVSRALQRELEKAITDGDD
jgi:transcriptional regulator with XRE-family HTH domain